MNTNRILLAVKNNPKGCLKAVSLIYGPACLIALNILIFHNQFLGVLSSLVYFTTITLPIYRRFEPYFGEEKVTRYLISALTFLLIMSIFGAFFVIFSSLTKDVVVYILLLISAPFSLYKIMQQNSNEVRKEQCRFHLSRSILTYNYLTIALSVVTLSLLIADIAILTQNRSDDSRWVWLVIPQTHLWLLFMSTLAVVLLIFTSKNNSIRIAFLIAYSIVVHMYIPLTVGTIFGGDSWQMIGEMNASINGIDRYANEGSTLASRHIEIVGVSIPEKWITEPSRGIANSFSIIMLETFQVDAYSIWPFFSPILWGIFVTVILFRLGQIISNGNTTFSLIIAFSASLASELIIGGAYSVKSSISMPFFMLSLLIWIIYLKEKDKSAKVPLLVTFLNVLNYSLFFFMILQVAIISMITKRFTRSEQGHSSIEPYNRTISLVRKPFFLLFIPLAISIPLVDTLEFTRFSLPSSTIGTSIGHWLISNSGINGPREAYFTPYKTGLGSGEYWLYSNLFIAGLVGIGIFLNRTVYSKFFLLLLMLMLSTEFSIFISSYFMEGARPLSRYLPLMVDLFKIPFIASGIYGIYEWSKETINESIKRSALSLFLLAGVIGMMCITVTSAQALETRTTWVARSDLDAAKFIITSNKPRDFAVITDLFAAFPIYAYTNGLTDGGGFYNDQIPDVLYKARTREIYDQMLLNPSRQLLDDAAHEAHVCKVYMLMPSYLPKNDQQLKAIGTVMGDYKYFSSVNQYTIVFGYDICSNRELVR